MFNRQICSTYARAFIAAMSVAMLVFASGCAKDEDSSGGGGSGEVTFQGVASVISSSVTSRVGRSAFSSVSDYKMYCITFEATPQAITSDIDADGNFSLDIPSGTPFGCFINSASTNAVACVINVVDSDSTDMSGNASQSGVMNLDGDVELSSAISCDPAVGVATIAKSELAKASNSKGSGLDIDSIHGKTYAMSCITTGDSDSDAKCAHDMDNSSVYFRVIHGTKGDKEITGLGAWQSEQAFNDCGGFDVDSHIGTEVTLATGNTSGDWTGASCTMRSKWDESGNQVTGDRPENLYALEKIKNEGGMWKMVQNEGGSFPNGGSGTCYWTHQTAINFGKGKGECDLIGNFQMVATQSCDSTQNKTASFMVCFKEQ